MINPKREIWLRGNRRVYTAVLVPVLLILLGSVLVVTDTFLSPALWLRFTAAVAAGFSGVVTVSLLYWIQRPLLAYQNGYLLVYLRPPQISRIPIELVEVFFAGQSESRMPPPVTQASNQTPESRNVVVRLAERATDYHQRLVKPSLGSWQDGYIVVRGTWSEPITKQVFRRLNRRLMEVHRESKATKTGAVNRYQPGLKTPLKPEPQGTSDADKEGTL